MKQSRNGARLKRHARVRKLILGEADRPRLAVFKSNRYIYAQIIDDRARHTIAAASSQEPDLRRKRLTVETATEVGKILGERAKEAGVSVVVFDRGGYPYQGRVKALADAVRQAGVEI